jgi:hypothetical protein
MNIGPGLVLVMMIVGMFFVMASVALCLESGSSIVIAIIPIHDVPAEAISMVGKEVNSHSVTAGPFYMDDQEYQQVTLTLYHGFQYTTYTMDFNCHSKLWGLNTTILMEIYYLSRLFSTRRTKKRLNRPDGTKTTHWN